MNNSYKLPADTNPDKVFIVNRSELEGRIDSYFYTLKFKLMEEVILKSKYVIVLLKDISISITNGYDFRDYKQDGTPYIKVANVKQGYFDFGDIQYIDILSEVIGKKIQLEKGNILLTRKGTFGSALSLDKDYNYIISSEVFLIKLRQDKIKSKYLEIYFNSNIGQQQFKRVSIGAIMGSLSQEALKKVFIPLPPLEVQQQIVDLYENAYNQKQQKEAEAKALLDGIDNYLLGELGITLPEKDNDLEKRVFITQFSEVAGGRLDPDYNSKLEYLFNQKANFEYSFLKDLIIKSPQYGANEEAIDGNSEKDIRYIRITDIDEYGILKEDGFKTAQNTDAKYLLNYNDLLFARSGSVGRCYIHKKNNLKSIFAGYLIRFVVNPDKANPDFVFCFCNSKIYKFWVSAIERPAVQSNINSEEFKTLPIPLPPLDKQNEIAEHIQSIRERAKQLQEEAKNLLDEAKQQVEQMILG